MARIFNDLRIFFQGLPNLCPLLPNKKFKSFDENSDEKNSIQKNMVIRVRPDFLIKFITTNASSGNKHFFTKSFHRQTYQNYEQN